MLTKLFIENFQSLMFPQSIRLAPLTLIVGDKLMASFARV